MSPTTLSQRLKSLESARTPLISRIIDQKSRPPRIYYQRTLKTPPGQVDYNKWIRPRLQLIRQALELELAHILESPRTARYSFSLMNLQMTSLRETIWSNCAATMQEFNELVRSKRIVNTARLEAARKNLFAEFPW